jgi:hypothetical protein
MPEDPTTRSTDEPGSDEFAHDDIVKRLLDYQRQLREGKAEQATPPDRGSVATATVPEQLVDLTASEIPDVAPAEVEEVPAVEATGERVAEDTPRGGEQPVPAEPAAGAEASGRLERLERSLAEIASMLSSLRKEFQDLAIAADERIARIEEAIARARGEGS